MLLGQHQLFRHRSMVMHVAMVSQIQISLAQTLHMSGVKEELQKVVSFQCNGDELNSDIISFRSPLEISMEFKHAVVPAALLGICSAANN